MCSREQKQTSETCGLKCMANWPSEKRPVWKDPHTPQCYFICKIPTQFEVGSPT